MVDEVSIVCLACGKAQKVSLDVVGDGKVFCAHCGREIPIPVAAPADSTSDHTAPADLSCEARGAKQDAATVVSSPANAPSTGTDTAESLLRDSDQPRYTEQETIGKGGMGEIVLCVERNTRRQVAMKRMLPTAAKHARSRARFVEEAQVTAQLEHPNIVPVHDLEMADDGTIYFTMKLVKGRSLEEILTATRDGDESHSLAELLQIFLKVCDGVAFAHSRGVIHRDLKPANIMVGDFGEVLVMDWGIAKILGADDIADEHIVGSSRQDLDQPELYTIAGKAMGSPVYMSPEQAAGDLDRIGPSSDIYSLGAILYEMLTLKRPLEGDTAQAVLAKVGKEQITPPEQRAPERNIPRELSAVAMKCLSKSPQQRYQSAMGLQRDVNLYLAGRSVSAAPDSFAQAFVKLLKRNKALSTAVTAAAVILIALGTVFIIGLKAERDVAVRERQIAQEARDKQRATALAAAESLAGQAIRAAEQGRFAEANVRADMATKVMPDGPWGPYAMGVVAFERKDFATARKHLTEALRLDASHAPSKAFLSRVVAAGGDLARAETLVDGADATNDWRSLAAAGDALISAQRYDRAVKAYERAAKLMEADATTPPDLHLETKDNLLRAKACLEFEGFRASIRSLPVTERAQRLRVKLKEIYGSDVKVHTTIAEDAITGIHLDGKAVRWLDPFRGMYLTSFRCPHTSVGDLSPLRAMPLTDLDAGNTRVVDLTPLKGMPLRNIIVQNTKVADLSPLEGMRLEKLSIGSTKVSDLRILKDMPLTYLNISHTRVTDLTPLKGMPLILFQCNGTRVSDLRPLAGMGLTGLSIDGTKVTDLTPLAGMKLRRLSLTPRNITKGIEILRGMKSLTRLAPHWDHGTTRDEFWKKYDAGEYNK